MRSHRRMNPRIYLPLWIAAAVAAPLAGAPAARIDFNRDIRPILSDKCFACHGPDDGQRQADLRFDTRNGAFAERGGSAVIIPGDRSASRLYQRINHGVEAARMPPPAAERKLKPEEVERIGAWIDQGADWQTHWAYVPPKRPDPPQVGDPAWAESPIDRLILARLELEGFEPSSPADKTTLLRRVALDLTGLPPTPEQVEAFVADRSPDAYEKRVDELLASPHYGERMAMPWLDAARYADTHGYHIDSHREMWRWRDWVIHAFNDNMPFDQFTVEQLAGDLLPDPTPSRILATGFNRNHMINYEGGAIPEEYQVEYVVDRIETTATVWMASTMGCSRCHDHKYDPFKQKEFYRFFAFFNTIGEKGLDGQTGNAAPVLELPSDEQKRRRQELEERIGAIEIKLSDDKIKPRQAGWEKTALDMIPTPPDKGLVARWGFEEDLLEDVGQETGATVRGELTYDEYGRLGRNVAFSGETHAEFGTAFAPRADKPFSLAMWVRVASFGSLRVLHKIEDTETRRGIELFVDEFTKIGEPYELFRGQRIRVRLSHQWPENAIEVRTARHIRQGKWHQLTVTYDGSASAAGLRFYVDGEPEETETISDSLSGPIHNDRPLGAGDKAVGPPFRGGLDGMRVYDRVLSPSEASNLAGDHPVRVMLANPLEGCPEYSWRAKQPAEESELSEEEKEAKKKNRRLFAECGRRQEKTRNYFLTRIATEDEQRLYADLLNLDKQLTHLKNEIPTVMVMSEMSKPRETFVLGRGDYRNQTAKVTAGVPAVLNPLPADAPPNRLGLARWLVDPANPLTARVTVNRYWQMIFGTGLVRTSEDFGSQGEPPSHPALLDWLAVEFVESGWDVKALLKKIVMSAAYRQSSRVTPEHLEQDPGNRLLARGPRFRLSAEGIRDSALAVSGLLNREIGGPSVYPYQPPGLWEEMAFGDVFSAQTYTPGSGKDLYRRGMYTFWKRTVPPASLATFDAPDREECRTRRARTNTPLQALVLMNDPTYVEASRHLAQRMILEAGDDADQRIAWAFRRATGRAPQPGETAVLASIAREQEADYRNVPEAARELITVGESKYDPNLDPVELAAWTTVAGTILNLDEVVTKE